MEKIIDKKEKEEFRKSLREQLKILGCSVYRAWRIETLCTDEMIEIAIKNSTNPKDYAWMLIQ